MEMDAFVSPEMLHSETIPTKNENQDKQEAIKFKALSFDLRSSEIKCSAE
jgi:hypothetical protein